MLWAKESRINRIYLSWFQYSQKHPFTHWMYWDYNAKAGVIDTRSTVAENKFGWVRNRNLGRSLKKLLLFICSVLWAGSPLFTAPNASDFFHCKCYWTSLQRHLSWSQHEFFFSQHFSSLDLNVVVLTDSITSLGRLFHSFTTLCVKKCFLRLVRLLFIFSFNAWPLVLLCPSRVSRFVVTDWSYPELLVSILKTSITSPLKRLYAKVGMSSFFSLSS